MEKQRTAYTVWTFLAVVLMVAMMGIGFATLSGTLTVLGQARWHGPAYDVYISNISPQSNGGVTISQYNHATMSAKVSSASSGQFVVTVVNQSQKAYVFERVIDGSENSIEGIYSGTDIKYTLTGLSSLQELAAGKSVTFSICITSPAGVSTDQYFLMFNFIEKTGLDILPDGETTVAPVVTQPEPATEPEATPDTQSPFESSAEPDTEDVIETPTEASTEAPTETETVIYNDFRGLVQALLEGNHKDGLNNSNTVYDAVQNTLRPNSNRGEDDAYIIHCSVKCIPGGNLSNLVAEVNQNLTEELQFLFEADMNNSNRMYLYMYYASDCTPETPNGTEILTYKQVLSREDSTKEWKADGTYEGTAVVGDFLGGGNNNKDVHTISPYTWKAKVSPQSDSDN